MKEMTPFRRLSSWLSSHRGLILILLISLSINSVGIGWGLPNGNETWATDSLQPVTPLAIVKRNFIDEPWNSGWFYFKYPLGHPLVLSVVQLPYLAWLWATGEIEAPGSTYPYGFKHPERALTVMALMTRGVSVVMGVGVVACAYVIGLLLFGRSTALVAAVLVTGCYPIVYFAHTSNVDVPALFWTALAAAAVLVCVDYGSRRAAAIAGLAAGMALFTKEQSVGVLIALPLVWLLRLWLQGSLQWRERFKHVGIAAVAFLAVVVLAGNLWWNPAGFVNRWLFLLGMLPAEIRAKYAPYQFSLQKPIEQSAAGEIVHLLDTLGKAIEGLTEPVALLCVAGAVWALWRHPRSAAVLLMLLVTYYVVSLRAIVAMNVKYTIPLQYFLLILGGVAGGALFDRVRHASGFFIRQAAMLLAVVGLGAALLPGIDLDRLIANDPRYAAEAWLQSHAGAGSLVETYQDPTRLPRFAPGLKVSHIPMEERTLELFAQRRPDFVVLSSGAQVRLTYERVKDWQPGDERFVLSDAAQGFFERLRAEEMGYKRVARFHTPIRWITPPFGSVNPEIIILARDGAG